MYEQKSLLSYSHNSWLLDWLLGKRLMKKLLFILLLSPLTFSENQMLPAAAQGAIGIEVNSMELESDIGNLLKLIND